ncbi:uncharacterized protein LOC134268869 [Saccostrea cucullata]|uniref:uncharacterized protein LOC134268869 n=1 Tax=Saccostrea cuccullata TaxID=36930 RepID=UPI002ED4FB89
MANVRILFLIMSNPGFIDISQSPQKVSAQSCDGKNGCCAGFTWDASLRACRKCTDGYFGLNCSQPCLYPYYGENCSAKCQCAVQFCNNTFGCFDNQSTTETDRQLSQGITLEIETHKRNAYDESAGTIGHMFSHDTFKVILSIVCVGIVLLLIFLITNFILYIRTLNILKNHYGSTMMKRCFGSLKNEQNIQKIIEGTANISMIYDKKRPRILLKFKIKANKQIERTTNI